MKKLIALLLTMVMVLSLAACGKKEETKAPEAEMPEVEAETPTPEMEDVVLEPEVVDPDAGVPAAPTEEPDVPAQMPEVAPEMPEVQPEVKPEPEAKPENPAVPEEKPQETPAANVDLNAFYESVAASITDWPMMMPLEGEGLDAFYPGLSTMATKQSYVYMPMMSAVACEIALVEVENAADVQAVKDIFQSRIAYQVGDENNPGGAWYPESIEGWKNNSRIVSNGNYVMMVAFSECDAFVSGFNALFA